MSKNNSTASSKSVQVVKTPANFMSAINNRWKVDWDLAATSENAQYPNFITERFYRQATPKSLIGYYDFEHSQHNPPNLSGLPGSFGVAWYGLSKNYLFLNPPFCNSEPACEPDCKKEKCKKRGSHNLVAQLGISKWMEKCKYESKRGAKILTLTLASLESNWYREHVKGNAAVWVLDGRMIFEGHKDVYPKALMLCEWGSGLDSFGHFNWKSQIPETPQAEKEESIEKEKTPGLHLPVNLELF